jgi:hypothetical protein
MRRLAAALLASLWVATAAAQTYPGGGGISIATGLAQLPVPGT